MSNTETWKAPPRPKISWTGAPPAVRYDRMPCTPAKVELKTLAEAVPDLELKDLAAIAFLFGLRVRIRFEEE